jgi:hypothetical protein
VKNSHRRHERFNGRKILTARVKQSRFACAPAYVSIEAQLQGVREMRLRAQIVIDIDADDFAEAATHQHRLESIYAAVRGQYEQAQLEFRQRRQRPARGAPVGRGLRHYTGRMSEYAE